MGVVELGPEGITGPPATLCIDLPALVEKVWMLGADGVAAYWKPAGNSLIFW